MESFLEGIRGGFDSGHVMPSMTALMALGFMLLLFQLKRKSGKRQRLPPGPQGIPIFGSILSLAGAPYHQIFAKLAARYGPIVYFRIGNWRTVAISSPEVAKEILKTKDHIWTSRPAIAVAQYLSYNGKSIGSAEQGPAWRNARKICALELFTPQRINGFEGLRQVEVGIALQILLAESQHGGTVNMQDLLASVATNIVTQMMWKKRHFIPHASSAAEATAFQDLIRETFSLIGDFNIADCIPVLWPVAMLLQGNDKRMKAVHKKFDDFLDTVIEEHRKKMEKVAISKPQLEPVQVEDFLEVLLKPSKNKENNREALQIDVVKAIILDMVLGGTDTTATVIEWAMAELIKNPSVMRRLQDELDSVVGRNRIVRDADIGNLVYLQAVMKEVFRLHPPDPLLIPHKSTQDSELAGYFIPAGTHSFINVYAIQRDPAIWERPLEFSPDRFLNSTIDVKGQDFELLPFGSGRRICPAATLSLLTVQSTVAQLVHTFTWSLPDGRNLEKLDMSENLRITAPRLNPLLIVCKPRLSTEVITSHLKKLGVK